MWTEMTCPNCEELFGVKTSTVKERITHDCTQCECHLTLADIDGEEFVTGARVAHYTWTYETREEYLAEREACRADYLYDLAKDDAMFGRDE